MAWVRDTGWGGVHQSNTWSALTTQPSFYTLIPESCPFLSQREPSRKKSQMMVGEKATIIYAHEKWSTAMRWSPTLVSTKRDHQICPSDKSEFGKENAVASDFTYGNLFYPYKAESEDKNYIPKSRRGSETHTDVQCLSLPSDIFGEMDQCSFITDQEGTLQSIWFLPQSLAQIN